MRGEDIGEVSRRIRVAPPELERWRREFLEGGRQGLKRKNRPGGRADADPGEAGRDDDAGQVAGRAARKKRGCGDELRKLLRRLDG